MASRVIVPLLPGSDGDESHRPLVPPYTPAPHSTVSNYLEKLGSLWMKSRGRAMPGVTYILERLPAGYAVMGRPRTDGRYDYYLFGHPQHKRPYDSPNQFFPHFKHLMDHGGKNAGCPCTTCSGKKRTSSASSKTGSLGGIKKAPLRQPVTKAPPRATAPPPALPKIPNPGMNTSRVDEEGTPDVYRHLINKLKKEDTLDEPITEPLSMDWRAEQECLPKLKNELKQGQKWLPRAGEIVLFVREMPKDVSIVHDPKSEAFKMYDEISGSFLDYPEWEAGLVGQTPVEQTIIDDLVEESSKEWSVAYSGIRVEPLPDINSSEGKSLSKHYKYVPLHHTRPFVFWSEFLANIPRDEWNPTIKNALAAMSTVSLVDKFRFRGTWPEATIFCTAIYIGSEMLAVGDAARLLPLGGGPCTQVLIIKSIRLRLTNLDLASDNDYDEGRPYNTSIDLYGKGYTINPENSKAVLPMDSELLEVMKGYNPVYPLHLPTHEMKVPFSRILGRLYDADSLYLRSLTDEQGSASALDLGREGVLEARAYARDNDQRIVEEEGSRWFWADNRAEALDLETVNGLEISKFQPELERNPKKWRQEIKVMDEAAKERERMERVAALPTQHNFRDFMAPTMMQSGQAQRGLPVRNNSTMFSEDQSSRTSSVLPTTELYGTSGIASGTGSKRRANEIINLSSDEDGDVDDQEIRKHTKLLNNTTDQARFFTRKANVAVVIKKTPG